MWIWKYHLITYHFKQYLLLYHINFLSFTCSVFLTFPTFIILFLHGFLPPASSTANAHFYMFYFNVIIYLYLQKMSLVFLNNDIPNTDNNDHTLSPSSTEIWSLPVSSCPTPAKFPFSSSFFYSSFSYFFLCFLIWPAWPCDVGNYLKQYLQVYNGFFLVFR